MCGIAGFSLHPSESFVNSRRLSKSLLLNIEHRGPDATGAAWLDGNGRHIVQKAPLKAREFVDGLSMFKKADTAILHTRYPTQGHEKYNVNNHPIQAGRLIGVHNGSCWNDDTIFTELGIEDRRQGKVDSEAIFALLAWGLEPHPGDKRTRLREAKTVLDLLEFPEGGAAIAWLDRSKGNLLHLARLRSSPLIIAQTKGGSTLFASEESALQMAAWSVGLDIGYVEEAKEGSYYTVRNGIIHEACQFKPAESYSYTRTTYGTYSAKAAAAVFDTARPGTRASEDEPTTNVGGTTRYGFTNGKWGKLEDVDSTDSNDQSTLDDMLDELDDDIQGAAAARYAKRIQDTRSLDYIHRDVFHYTAPLKVDDALYTERDENVTDWCVQYEAGLDGDDLYSVDDLWSYAESLGGGLVVGDWVRVSDSQFGQKVYAEIVRMPFTFPYGNYIVRAHLPTATGFRTVLTQLTIWEMTVMSVDTQYAVRHMHAPATRKALLEEAATNATSAATGAVESKVTTIQQYIDHRLAQEPLALPVATNTSHIVEDIPDPEANVISIDGKEIELCH